MKLLKFIGLVSATCLMLVNFSSYAHMPETVGVQLTVYSPDSSISKIPYTIGVHLFGGSHNNCNQYDTCYMVVDLNGLVGAISYRVEHRFISGAKMKYFKIQFKFPFKLPLPIIDTSCNKYFSYEDHYVNQQGNQQGFALVDYNYPKAKNSTSRALLRYVLPPRNTLYCMGWETQK